MRFVETSIAGAWLVHLDPLTDERGVFARVWCEDEFAARGLCGRFVQCNTSRSRLAATLRGLHWQAAPHGEVKLMRCVRARCTTSSPTSDPTPRPTCGGWGSSLTADTLTMLYVPAGCAHGYETLVDDSEVMYPVSAPYVAASERGLRWNDPAFGIEWPLRPAHVSPKDASWPDFARETKAGLP